MFILNTTDTCSDLFLFVKAFQYVIILPFFVIVTFWPCYYGVFFLHFKIKVLKFGEELLNIIFFFLHIKLMKRTQWFTIKLYFEYLYKKCNKSVYFENVQITVLHKLNEFCSSAWVLHLLHSEILLHSCLDPCLHLEAAHQLYHCAWCICYGVYMLSVLVYKLKQYS